MSGGPTPMQPGFYWAKWRLAEEDTPADLAATLPHDKWEVVEVWENSLDPDSDEHFRVSVTGIRESQLPENFIWGAGPLDAPANEPSKLSKVKPDFTIGRRGGDWYGFSNCRKATDHIRRHGVVSGNDPTAIGKRLEGLGFTWKKEGL